jgi:hypothetical protein
MSSSKSQAALSEARQLNYDRLRGRRRLSAIEKLANIQAQTLDDLRCKARVAVLTEEQVNAEQPLSESIIDDLLHS